MLPLNLESKNFEVSSPLSYFFIKSGIVFFYKVTPRFLSVWMLGVLSPAKTYAQPSKRFPVIIDISSILFLFKKLTTL